MTDREKLIELLLSVPSHEVVFGKREGKRYTTAWHIANHLIANGVTVHNREGCEYCEEYEDLPEHFMNGKPVGKVFDTCIQMDEDGLWHLETPSTADIGIKFCPMCGRKLPEQPKGE